MTAHNTPIPDDTIADAIRPGSDAPRKYTSTRMSLDGMWHVATETPSCIATPHGGISIAWGGTDETRRELAEKVAADIVKAMNRRATLRAEIAQLTAERDANVQAKLALMKAGTFADGVRAAAKIVHGEELNGGRYRTWPQWGTGNREREAPTVSLVDTLEVAILALADLPANEGEKL